MDGVKCSETLKLLIAAFLVLLFSGQVSAQAFGDINDFRTLICTAHNEFSIAEAGIVATQLFSTKKHSEIASRRLLESLSTNDDPFVRAVAIWGLSGDRTGEATLRIVTRAIRDSDRSVRVEAARILQECFSERPGSLANALKIAGQEVAPGVDELLLLIEVKGIPKNQDDVHAVLGAFENMSAKVRHAAFAAASRTDIEVARVGRAFSYLLRDETMSLSERVLTCNAIGRLLSKEKFGTNALVDQMRHADVRVRIAAERAIACSGAASEPVVAQLVERLASSEQRELICVCYALSRISPGNKLATDKLQRLQSHDDPEVRRWASFACDPSFADKSEMVIGRKDALLCISRKEGFIVRISDPYVDEGVFTVECCFEGRQSDKTAGTEIQARIVGRSGKSLGLQLLESGPNDIGLDISRSQNRTVSLCVLLPKDFSPQVLNVRIRGVDFDLSLPFGVTGKTVENDLLPALSVDSHCY